MRTRRALVTGSLLAVVSMLAFSHWARASEPSKPAIPASSPSSVRASPSGGSSPSLPLLPALPAGRDFGAGLTLAVVADLEDVVRDPGRYSEDPILVRGRISDVCQKKGCWTVLSQGKANVRVRFKDYGFFLPTDSSGKQAYVEGVVKLETLSEKRARHYASESQSGSAEAIHGPQREVGFTASGVRLVSD